MVIILRTPSFSAHISETIDIQKNVSNKSFSKFNLVYIRFFPISMTNIGGN